jgi:hypothetical protein
LLAAQAACPAWAFYQYRLGAAVLPAPTFGLDALARGSLLHAALEAFWVGRGLAELLAMDDGLRAAEIARVVALALADHDRAAVLPLPPRLRALEAKRLGELLATWLEVEATRSPFRVLAREERHRLDIEGLPVTVVVDRVDELGDGTGGWPSSITRAGAPTGPEPGPTRASPSRSCRSTPRWPFPIAPWPPSRWRA